MPHIHCVTDLIDLREADETALEAISQEQRLALDLQEMLAIQTYYRQEGRAAIGAELEILAQMWIEHAAHKTLKAIIQYTGPDGEQQTIDGLLNTYIRAATEKLNKPWLQSAFDEQLDLAFKVEAQADDLIVAIGGREATFSSMEMDRERGEIAETAVPISNPIMEKQVQKVVLRARDEGLYSAITGCGARSFASAVGEMAASLGAAIQLENVSLNETQERIVLAVPAAKLARMQAICVEQNVEAIVVGRFITNGRLTLHDGEEMVGDVDIAFLHEGIPTRRMVAEWQGGEGEQAIERLGHHTLRNMRYDGNFKETLLKLLAHPDIRQRRLEIRDWGLETIDQSLVSSPLTNFFCHTEAIASARYAAQFYPSIGVWCTTSLESLKGVALANGFCPSYSAFDPYNMAWAAIDKALRHMVAVGTDPEQVAIWGDFYWDDPNLPDRLGALVRCTQGCHEAALAYETPFIVGKSSLHNEYAGVDGRKQAISGSLLISAMGIVPDVMQTVTMDLKQAGDFLFVVGDTRAELGGSHFRLVGETAAEGNYNSPEPAFEPLHRLKTLHKAMQAGLVQACHDCSEGGIAVAMAEMCIAGGWGLEAQLMRIPRDWHANYSADEVMLFSESLTRFLVEVRPEDEAGFREIMANVPHECVGVVGGDRLRVNGRMGEPLLMATVVEMEEVRREASEQ